MKILKFIQKNLALELPVAMIFGIFSVKFFEWKFLQNLLPALTFAMIFPQMVNLNFAAIFQKCAPRLQFSAQFLNFAVVPFFGFFLGKIFFAANDPAALGLLLVALLPTGSMTISWTGLTGGNLPAAIKISLFGLFAAALAAPIYLKILVGKSVPAPFFAIAAKIATIILVPLFVGFLTRKFLMRKFGAEKFSKKIAPNFAAFSAVGVLAMVFAVMHLKAQIFFADPFLILRFAAPIAIFYAGNFAFAAFLGRIFFARRDAIALVFGTAMRHLAISLALAVTLFKNSGGAIAGVVAVAFVFQLQIAAIFAKFVPRIFGEES
jgi:ACR3 family arsenite efflux pump ArsB